MAVLERGQEPSPGAIEGPYPHHGQWEGGRSEGLDGHFARPCEVGKQVPILEGGGPSRVVVVARKGGDSRKLMMV